jgi:hypothetical protein
MFSFAQRFARTAFGIGVAIGLVLNIGLYEPVTKAAVLEEPPVCGPHPTLSPELQSFIALQCQVHQILFGDETAPATAYALEHGVTAPGVYYAQDYLNRTVKLDAVWAKALDLKSNVPSAHAQGVEANVVVGMLSTDAGAVPVLALDLLTGTVTPDQPHVLIVSKVLSSQDLDLFSVASRIAAGVRVVNTATGKSILLSELEGSPQLTAYTSDLATLYCGCDGDGGGVDPGCVKHAYDTYNNNVKTAQSIAEICVFAAIATWLTCTTGCAVAAILGPLAVVGGTVCYLGCLAVEAIMLASCAAVQAAMLDSALRQLQIDLAACGVNMVGL